ncbi:MAG: DNA polymerase III subunit alpha [Patescibacteria group bacterium]|nr:DNA polymerase III subunit alpha [Patescibacteria group bacterium]MDD5490288.1 DNA polymerase III subunit alpha [Patescibacteria group bacterium]
MEFVHLHLHSHYSLLDGLSKIDDLVLRAKDYNMKSLALTDHGVLYGAVEFYQKAKKAGIKPIIGVETYMAPNGRHSKNIKTDERPYHLVLLAYNNQGYKNLLKIVTIAHLEGFYYKPRIDWEVLEQYHEGLIATSACLAGEIPRSILNGDLNKTREIIKRYKNILGPENFYLEVHYHPSMPEQEEVNKAIFSLSKELDVPVIAAVDSHYLYPEDNIAQDILLCLQNKTTLNDEDRRLCMMGEDYSFSAFEKALQHFSDHPEIFANTLKIAERCNVELELKKVHLPFFEVPGGKTPEEYLRELCEGGLEKRYGITPENRKNYPEIIERLNYELSVIGKTGFASYFLIVQDFVNWAKNNGIVVGPGRGSAAGSIVSYLANITNIDPLKYDLLFERFLNPERISMPDIDLDFADTRRDEVIRYVEGKYGKDHVAQIITFGTMAARAAVRDVGRVLGLSYSYCDKIAKMIPMMMDLSDALEKISELKDAYNKEADAKKLLDLAKRLEGSARHASTHACGVLITKDPLTEYVPLQYASSGDKTIVSQYSLHPIEDLGLLKMDFLGLKNLTILENTLEILKKGRNIELDVDKLPLEDKKTFKLLQAGLTTGVFQLESSGMKRYLKQLKPTNFEDIIAMVALYRPGPMEWIPDYIAGKNGKKEIRYLHPKLKPILSKTFGVAIYQEQVLQIARDLAGFTLGEADVLRKAVGKKIAELLQEQKTKFINGCVKNGIDESTARTVFEFIEPFAGYGFNRAHATCYAMIAYETAFMKANYPKEFMASLLTAEQNDIDRIAILVEECNQMGIEVLPPDINESYKQFTAVMASDKSRIRFGLLAIKNVGENVVQTIITERKTNGPYKDLEDFLTRVKTKDLNKKSLESLVKCGALDKFGERNQMLQNTERILAFIKETHEEINNNQGNLFGLAPAFSMAPSLKLDFAEPATDKQKLAWERELLGLYVSEHPANEFAASFKNLVLPIGSLERSLTNKFVNILGVVGNIKKVLTRSGEQMLFAKIEDGGGSTEAIVFPKLLQNTYALWQDGKMVILNGRISDKDGEVKILVERAEELTSENKEVVYQKFYSQYPSIDISHRPDFSPKTSVADLTARNIPQFSIIINLPASANGQVIKKLKEFCFRYPGERKVFLKITGNSESVKTIETNFKISFNDEIKSGLEEIAGPGTVFSG